MARSILEMAEKIRQKKAEEMQRMEERGKSKNKDLCPVKPQNVTDLVRELCSTGEEKTAVGG